MNKIKIFLAAPISAFDDENEYRKYRNIILSLILSLRQDEFDVYSEVEHVTEKSNYDSPAQSVKDDFEKIKKSDVFLLFHPKKAQTSALIELGYAYAMQKKVIIISRKELLPYLALGILSVCSAAIIIELCNEFGSEFYEEIKNALTRLF